jgi:enoyl-CoA hydratase/carnithine racemase
MNQCELDDWLDEIEALDAHRCKVLKRADEHKEAGRIAAAELAEMLAESADDEIHKIKGRIWAAQAHAALEAKARGELPL